MDDERKPGSGATRRTFMAGMTALAAAAPLAAAGGAHPKPAVVMTTAGRVRGAIDRGVHVFRGVPYGAPTGGANRFRAPQPVVPWKGIRDASQFGSASPQHADQAFDDNPTAKPPSEDCLMINIWTPGVEPAAKRPVMVWFHGGGYAVGSGQEYVNDGANLSDKQDVVLVTINHRLNAFGYLYFGDLAGPGEAPAMPGQQDLVAALRWVRDNIAQFGGDPGNVTIFGQSGGGGKVSAVMAMPSAKGLFHKAIIQSGFGTSTVPLDEAKQVVARLFEATGVAPGDMAGLRRLSTQQILDGYFKATNGIPLIGANIVADGEILPRVPFVPGEPSPSPEVPVLLGHNATEATVLFPPPEAFTIDWQGLPGLFANDNGLFRTAKAREPKPMIKGFRRIMPQASASDVYFAIATEAGMGKGARIVADNRARMSDAPIYQYLLTWRTSVQGGKLLSPHGAELPMVFDTAYQKFGLIGNDQAEFQKMADIVSPMWAEFARSGSPNRPGLPDWPAYKIGERAVMVIDKTCAAQMDPLGVEQALIDEYY